MEDKSYSTKLHISIDGMSCHNCERRIKTVLSKLTGVIQADVSFEKRSADVEFDQRVTDKNDLFLAIAKLGYKVTADSQNSITYPVPIETKPKLGIEQIANGIKGQPDIEKESISISGMHCKSCEMRIEDQFMRQEGVIKAIADFKTGTLNLVYAKGYSLKQTNKLKLVEELGYSIGKNEKKLSIISKNPKDYQDLGIALVILLGLYAIISGLGIGDLAPSTSSKSFSLPIIILIGLTAGFSTCMALVGGLVLGISAKMSEAHPNATPSEKFRPHLFFCSGRILSYILLGGVLGLVGSVFQFSSFSLGLLTIVIGVVMLVMGIQLLDIFPWANRLKLTLPKSISRKFGSSSAKKYSHGNAMVLGALTFFLPCGFTQAMQVYAIGTGNFVDGALTMGAFVIGTIPGLLGIGGLTSVVKGTLARRFFKLAGLVVVCFAVFNISNGMGLSGLSLPGSNETRTSLVDPNVTIENGVQVVRMKEVEDGYVPRTFAIRSDLPVKWVIDAEAPMSCAASLTVPKYGIRKTLNAGENVIEFIPTGTGLIKFTCSMGMHTGSFTVLDPSGKIFSEEIVQNASEEETDETTPEYSVAKVNGAVQHVESVVTDEGYQPIIVQKGIPVEWTIRADSAVLNACNNKIKIPSLDIEQELKAGPTIIRFKAPESGNLEFTCWMNMIKSTIRIVDTIDASNKQQSFTETNKRSLAMAVLTGCCRHNEKSCER